MYLRARHQKLRCNVFFCYKYRLRKGMIDYKGSINSMPTGEPYHTEAYPQDFKNKHHKVLKCTYVQLMVVFHYYLSARSRVVLLKVLFINTRTHRDQRRQSIKNVPTFVQDKCRRLVSGKSASTLFYDLYEVCK